MLKTLSRFTVILALLAVFGCEDFLECVINVRPELPNKSLDLAQTDSYYFETIKAEVKNESNDNDYDYYFSLFGDLPEGLDYYIDYRTLVIEGFPTQEGTFTFEIQVTVEAFYEYTQSDDDDYFNDNDRLCGDTAQRTYSITVQ